MKRKLIVLSTTVFTFFFLAGIGQAQPKFSFKATGGYGSISTGDFNTVISSLDDLFGDLAAAASLLYGVEIAKEGEFEKMGSGLDFEGEFIVNLTENIGIGIGAGYILRKKDSAASVEFDPFFSVSGNIEPKITAIPVKLSAYYFYPVSSEMNIFVNGGIGYYFGKVTYSIGMDQSIMGLTLSAKHDGEIKGNGIGFHGGIGIEFTVAENIGFFVEGAGQYAKLKDWEGDHTVTSPFGTETMSGTFWYYELLDMNTGKYYSDFGPSKEEPTAEPGEPPYQNVRKAEVDLSGFSIRVGIRIKF